MKLTRINYDNRYLWLSKNHLTEYPINKTIYSFRYKDIVDFSLVGTQENLYLNECFEVKGQTNLSIPNVPFIEIGEEDVDLLAIPLAEKYVTESKDFKAEGISNYQNGIFNGFIEGYKAAKEKYAYTEEDLRKAMDYEYDMRKEFDKYGTTKKSREKFFASLNTPPNEIEIEMELGHAEFGSDNRYNTKPITYTKDNKTYLKVKQ